MDESRELLTKQIEEDIRNLSLSSLDSDERTAAVKNLSELYKLKIEESKIDVEIDSNEVTRETSKNDQNFQKVLQYLKTGSEIFCSIAPLIFYGIWMKRGFEFEKEGVYTSQTFKGLIKFFKPTKR